MLRRVTLLALTAAETLAVVALAVAFAMWMPGPVGFGTSGVGLVLTVVWVGGLLAAFAWHEFRG